MSGECDRCGEHCIECRCRDVADLSICRRRQIDRPVGDDELVRFLRHQAFAASQTSHARGREIGLRLAEAADRITDLQVEVERSHNAYMIAHDQAMDNGARLSSMREALVEAMAALRNHACHGGPNSPCLRANYQCRLECGREAGDALLVVEEALSDGGVEG